VSKEFLALALTLGVHVVGAAVVIWGLMEGERADWRSLVWPRDAGDDGPGPEREGDRTPVRPGGPGGLPLPDAAQSPVRLREPARLSDLRPRPHRRPAHVPDPKREPVGR